MSSIKNKLVWASLLCLSFMGKAQAQNYAGKSLKMTIFSSTPVEDVKAASTSASAVLVADKQELAVQLPIKSLEFDKKLMQQHFNENYMESDKYPMAKFKGTITPQLDWSKDGEYPVTVKGVLTVHGVEQNRTIPGKITIKGNTIGISSNFEVACKDHQIKIPRLVFAKIAEVIKITIQGNLEPLK